MGSFINLQIKKNNMTRATTQKINLMTTLTSFKTLSDKIIEDSSLKNKEIKKIIDLNSKSGIVFHKSIIKPNHSKNGKKSFEP